MDLGLEDRVALVTGASKGIGRGIAAALAADGVTVNAVLPGRIRTDRLAANHADPGAARQDVPIGRAGTIEEMGAAAAFLCSEPARYVTGQSLLVDGGLTRSW